MLPEHGDDQEKADLISGRHQQIFGDTTPWHDKIQTTQPFLALLAQSC